MPAPSLTSILCLWLVEPSWPSYRKVSCLLQRPGKQGGDKSLPRVATFWRNRAQRLSQLFKEGEMYLYWRSGAGLFLFQVSTTGVEEMAPRAGVCVLHALIPTKLQSLKPSKHQWTQVEPISWSSSIKLSTCILVWISLTRSGPWGSWALFLENPAQKRTYKSFYHPMPMEPHAGPRMNWVQWEHLESGGNRFSTSQSSVCFNGQTEW